jgi:hypothetical protein
LSPSSVEEADEPPQPTQLPTVSVPIVAVFDLISVVEALVAKKFVVVALVVVELPETTRLLPRVIIPLPSIDKIDLDEVANVVADDVAR